MLNFRRRVATFEEFVRELEGMLQSGAILLLIRRAKTGDPIGFALGYNINQWDGSMGVTMYLEERFQKRGYGGEAALLWTDFLFRTFPLRRITAEIYEFATSTLAIVQALGAEEVGFMPEHFWHEDRHWGVHYMMLTRESWLAHRRDFTGILDMQMRFEETEPVLRPAGAARTPPPNGGRPQTGEAQTGEASRGLA
jgi:RimJ/RimL family protein N-acetyltransferase